MSVAVVMLAAGYPIGGALGDALFKRTRRGRLIVSTVGVLLGAVFLFITLNVPVGNQYGFLGLLSVTAIFVPFASANVIATVYDVTLPEIRSSALAVQYFIESAGAALAPWLAGLIADRSSLQFAILTICISTWVICALFFVATAYLIPGDIETLRGQLRRRAERLRSR
jgi:MFS family permease